MTILKEVDEVVKMNKRKEVDGVVLVKRGKEVDGVVKVKRGKEVDGWGVGWRGVGEGGWGGDSFGVQILTICFWQCWNWEIFLGMFPSVVMGWVGS